MIVLFGHTKGGVGKTTCAVQTAIARARAGRKVWLVDGDPQGSSMAAIQLRADAGVVPEIACSLFSDSKQFRQQVRLQKDAFEDVILDVGGRDTDTLRFGLMIADVAVVPFAPMSLDLWAMKDMAKAVESVNDVREGLVTLAVMNKAEPRERSADNAEAEAMVREIETFRYLEAPLVSRKAFSASTGAGLGVMEMSNPDKKAVAELDRLIAAIFAAQTVEA